MILKSTLTVLELRRDHDVKKTNVKENRKLIIACHHKEDEIHTNVRDCQKLCASIGAWTNRVCGRLQTANWVLSVQSEERRAPRARNKSGEVSGSPAAAAPHASARALHSSSASRRRRTARLHNRNWLVITFQRVCSRCEPWQLLLKTKKRRLRMSVVWRLSPRKVVTVTSQLVF